MLYLAMNATFKKKRYSVTVYNFVNTTDLLLVWSAFSIILEACLSLSPCL